MMLQGFAHCAPLGGQFVCLGSIIANYNNIQLLWETAVSGASDTEMKARFHGIDSQMHTFKFQFCISLSEMILRHTDKLRVAKYVHM